MYKDKDLLRAAAIVINRQFADERKLIRSKETYPLFLFKGEHADCVLHYLYKSDSYQSYIF